MAYFSNSSEGEVLDIQCQECHIPNDAPCPVLWVQQNYNYDQVRNQLARAIISCLVDDNGTCQMKKQIDKLNIVTPDYQRSDQNQLF